VTFNALAFSLFANKLQESCITSADLPPKIRQKDMNIIDKGA